MNIYPKISIITPNYNGVKFIEKTVQSVLNQNYPNLEYIVVDGGSTDGSLKVIKKYDSKITKIISEPDNGLYDAINKGLKLATGEIIAWLNSDDIYLPNALFTVARIFEKFEDVNWLTATPTACNSHDSVIHVGENRRWSKFEVFNGDYKWIQQESTFWRRDLWEKAGGYIDSNYKVASDLDLWCRFFHFAKLYAYDGILASFRYRREQKSVTEFDNYLNEAESILKKQLKHLSKLETKRLKKVSRRLIIYKILYKTKLLNSVFYKEKVLFPLMEYPPRIIFSRENEKFELTLI
jgi:glycosyltransferase involved in cell wall biosynthesis